MSRVLRLLIVAAVGTITVSAARVATGQTAIESGRFVGAVEVGFDSFQERYSIVDEDTLDSVNEFRSRARIGYTRGAVIGNYFLLEARGLLGEDNYETAGRLRWTRRLPSITSTFQIETDVTRRGFHKNSTYQFPNDNLRTSARAFFRKAAGHRLSLRLTNYLENVDFDQRTEFDYDYLRNVATLSADFSAGIYTGVGIGLRYATMSVPDSSEIEYGAWQPIAELRWTPEAHKRVALSGSTERRSYGDIATRSSFWLFLASGGVEWPVHPVWSVELIDEIVMYTYDTNSDAYFGYVENRLAALVNYNPSWYLQAGAGPTYSHLRSQFSTQDEYDEFGARLSLEYMRGAKIWVSATYEPGRRNYLAYNGEDALTSTFATVFSDYTYHRLSLFVNARVRGGLGISLLADYQPEDHERQTDDATATLFSVGLSYIF